jgi:hypothetical protein
MHLFGSSCFGCWVGWLVLGCCRLLCARVPHFTTGADTAVVFRSGVCDRPVWLHSKRYLLRADDTCSQGLVA